MSRGHGRIQLQVLEFLLRFEDEADAQGEHHSFVPVIAIAGPSPSRSRIESIRRAVKSLADEGLIELSTDDSSRSGSHARQLSAVGASSGLMARLVTHRNLAERHDDLTELDDDVVEQHDLANPHGGSADPPLSA